MNTNNLVLTFKKPIRNIVAGMILILLSLVFGSNGYVKPGYIKGEETNLYKKEIKPRLFLITVIDSDDKIIGKRCEKDLEEITESFNLLALWLDIATVVPNVIKGNEFSKEAVNDAIDNWLKAQEPVNTDIVVFYYSGHGFRFSNDASVYPRMWLKTSSDQNTETTNLSMEEDIYNRLVTMGAGVNIVLSDCCNSVPGANTAFTTGTITPHEAKPPKPEELEENIKDFDKLFRPDYSLSILATAADSTELAGGTPKIGGFFTHYFLEALEISIYEDEIEPTWENILNYAKEEARKKALGGECPENKHNEKGRCVQIAKYKMNPEVTPE